LVHLLINIRKNDGLAKKRRKIIPYFSLSLQNKKNKLPMDTNKAFNEVAGRKNFGPSHALMTTPQPCVMIATWDKDHTPDVMMAAWAGQYDHNQIVVSMSKHKTTENIELTGAFTVSFADVRTVAESDYLGIASGAKVPDKVAKVGFTVSPSPNVDAPIIDQYPLTLECKVISWKDGILVGEVVNMSADECILTDGKVDLGKLQPIVFDAAALAYRALGEVVGQAWGSGKKFME
jgi:flavin reductase (DIM6/NTAB) family NADH-FMN oxidoreductase RutF